MSWEDIYGANPLAAMQKRRGPVERIKTEVKYGLVVEHTQTEWCGAIVAVSQGFVELEDWRGKTRKFAINDSFLIDGKAVQLVLPTAKQQHKRTASGSFAAAVTTAKVAKASRIFVEGLHDAELIEHVWGDDLRDAAIVVEVLEGADNLAQVLHEFQPSKDRRAGVLLDHLVVGSKESRLAEAAVTAQMREHVLIVGHPFVDVWQAIKPARLGLKTWPEISRSIEWKKGICQHFGWPHYEQADIAEAWQRLRSRVKTYTDLEPELVGPVEQLIDFVTA